MTISSKEIAIPLRNFIYLDEAKLNSFVSQAFSGVTEYIVSSSERGERSEESQKGPFVSGQILKAIFNEEESTLEKKFLYDYSYKIFEEHLDSIGAISDFTEDSMQVDIPACRFIRIKGKIKFTDIAIVLKSLKEMTSLSESFAFVAQWEEIKALEVSDSKRGKSSKESIRNGIKRNASQDAEYHQHLRNVLEFGYSDMFAIQSQTKNTLFTAEIKRQYLREAEEVLIRKYSRNSDRNFTILGTIARCPLPQKQEIENPRIPEDNLRLGLFQLIDSFSNVEETMHGNLSNEIVIDPIAVYSEI